MKRIILKQKLEIFYKSEDSIKSILGGRRKPSYSVMFKLNSEHKIPFTAWKDIKSFITNHTQSVTKKNDKNKVYEEKE